MTFAMNSIAAMLATLLLAGLLLFGSSAAQAHVVHGSEMAEFSLEVFGAELSDVDFAFGAEAGARMVNSSMAVPSNRSDKPHASTDAPCCASGIAGCSPGLPMQGTRLFWLPSSGTAVAPRRSTAWKGIILETLIRPPKALV